MVIGGQAAKPPRGFLRILLLNIIIIIIHLLLPWESMAAPRTAWSEVVSTSCFRRQTRAQTDV